MELFVSLPPKTFEWDTREAPSPLDAFRALCVAAGASDVWVAHVTPGFLNIVQRAVRAAYDHGSRDGASRSRNRPGDGDMGG